MLHSPTVLAREVVWMDGLSPIHYVVTLDGKAGGGAWACRGECGGWSGGGVKRVLRGWMGRCEGSPYLHLAQNFLPESKCKKGQEKCSYVGDTYTKVEGDTRGQSMTHTWASLFSSALQGLQSGLRERGGRGCYGPVTVT